MSGFPVCRVAVYTIQYNMTKRWNVEDEGEIADLLNVEITREGDHVVLRQRGYIDKMVSTYLTSPPSKLVKVPCTERLPNIVLDAQLLKSEGR